MTELRRNRLKHKLKEGGIATAASGYMTADLIEFLGPLGFDAMWIEGEHGPIDYGDLPHLTRACDLWGVASLARVNLNLAGVIYRTLDVGAQGIAVPHVNTAEEARAVVDAAKFHPLGARGITTGRQGIGVEDYYAKANDETFVMVLIEDIVAVDNLAEILEVDNIDVFFVAQGDLAQSMGLPGQPTHPDVKATLLRAVDQINKSGRVAGAVGTDANLAGHIAGGVRFFQVLWTHWLAAGAKSFMEKLAAASP